MAKAHIIDEVIKYYGSTVIDFKIFWSRSKDLALHYGYYDDGVKNHKGSLLKMNEVLAKFADIEKNDRVLDAGCGYGGSAIWLAKNIGCEVVGITVFPYHVSEAKKYAKNMEYQTRSVLEKKIMPTHLSQTAHSMLSGGWNPLYTRKVKKILFTKHIVY